MTPSFGRECGRDAALSPQSQRAIRAVRALAPSGSNAYPKQAGHISPAGVEPAKSGLNPALSRNCDAPSGDEPGRLPYADGRQLSTEGRFVRQAPPGLLRRFVEVFIA
jgi:hypothetical protein